jgi:dGTPase
VQSHERLHRAKSRKGEFRTPGQIDRDRVLYSSAFRRLAHVSQVISTNVGHVFHNRLTHSLQVGQVGRRVAERINSQREDVRLDVDIVEAACLAHDLGHPPFGHVAEYELNEIVSNTIDGFEGNAQSFRIVSKLAFRSPEYEGLNLTRGTLNAILKYPWLHNQNAHKPDKWGAYDSEREEFNFARDQFQNFPSLPCIEAQVMDWADDVTYSVHDLEDFYRAGKVPLHALADLIDGRERRVFFDEVFERRKNSTGIWLKESREDLEEAFLDIVAPFNIDEPFNGSRDHRARLRSFTGLLINRYVGGLTIRNENGRWVLVKNPQFEKEITMLKELTWHYVINAPSMATYQLGQRKIIKNLFEIFGEAADWQPDWKVFPQYFRERLQSASTERDRIRIVVDFISGLTEPQAIALHQQVTGNSLGFGLVPLV